MPYTGILKEEKSDALHGTTKGGKWMNLVLLVVGCWLLLVVVGYLVYMLAPPL